MGSRAVLGFRTRDMVGASPKASSLKLWASGVPLVSVLVGSLQTRCKNKVWGWAEWGCGLARNLL